MSIESAVAARLAHQERVVRVLARTGGEVMHPTHYDIREALRSAVLAVIDETTTDMDMPRMSDGELPGLFKAVDAVAERLFLARMGL